MDIKVEKDLATRLLLIKSWEAARNIVRADIQRVYVALFEAEQALRARLREKQAELNAIEFAQSDWIHYGLYPASHPYGVAVVWEDER